MTKNFSEKEYREKLDMPLGNSNNKQSSELVFKKRKDPRSMTTEELEEYISRNKVDKSLNSSFHSQKNLNYSFTAAARKENNENVNNYNNETLSKNLGGLNYNYLGSSSNSNITNNISSVNNPFLMNNGNNLNLNSNINNVYTGNNVNSGNNNMLSPYQKEQLNTNTSNISYDPLSDGEEKYFKFKLKNLSPNNLGKVSPSNNSINNSNNNLNSNAANNYLKSLQEKNRSLANENEELKKNFVEVSEILEKERAEFQKKIINEINKTTEVERSLKNEIHSSENENKSLVDEVNELRMKTSLLNSNISILENEKNRHLELNSAEKENLHNEINNIYQENEENKNRLNSLNDENNILRDKLTKVK